MTNVITREGLLKEGTSKRYLSLDVLRGLTIALMLVVNTPGSWGNIYAPFRHAAWHGFTITDLVFPTFLFVVGNAMSFSMRKFENLKNKVLLRKIFTRSALIFLLGTLVTLFPLVARTPGGDFVWKDFSSLRIMGVLERIALCYLIAALAIHYLKARGAAIFGVFLLFFYWGVMYFFGDQPDPYTLEGNAALKFDLLVFSPENLYEGYGIPFDPEGLLSTLPAVVNVILGYLAGLFIQRKGNKGSTVLKLFAAGIVFLVLGLLWDPYFPINKPIWTSSYVLYTTGWDLLLLAVLMGLIELAGYKKWTYFFEVFGKNPLFIYIMAGLVVRTLSIIHINDTTLKGWLYENLFLTWSEGKTASLLFALFYMLMMWLLGYWMDKNKIYIKV